MHVTHAVDHDTDKSNLQIDLLQSIECHSKVVNMCCMVDYDRVLTCSREPVVKLWGLSGAGEEPLLAQFTGHKMPVSTLDYEPRSNRFASAGRDCTTRVWDVETQKSVMKREIARCLATQLKWMPN